MPLPIRFSQPPSVPFIYNALPNSLLDLAAIAACFGDLPLDPYLPGGYRFKSLFRAYVDAHGVRPTSHAPLYQSNDYNPVHGGLHRDYQLMDAALQLMLHPVVRWFAAEAGLSSEDEVLVQAQRVRGRDDVSTEPTIEGWHQDGCKWLGLLMVARHNISGGRSQLSPDAGRTLVFNRQLSPGDFLLVNDEKLFHYVTPLSLVTPGQAGWRDLVILTHPACRPPTERR